MAAKTLYSCSLKSSSDSFKKKSELTKLHVGGPGWNTYSFIPEVCTGSFDLASRPKEKNVLFPETQLTHLFHPWLKVFYVLVAIGNFLELSVQKKSITTKLFTRCFKMAASILIVLQGDSCPDSSKKAFITAVSHAKRITSLMEEIHPFTKR